MRFIEEKSEKIVRGILLSGLIYLFSSILILLAQGSTSTSLTGHYIAIAFLKIGTISKIISSMLLFKFLCDVVCKLLKVADIFISKNGNK